MAKQELKRARSRSTTNTTEERLEPQLQRAIEDEDEGRGLEKLRGLIDEARAKNQLQDHHLRIALMRSSLKNKIAATRYLLSEGAPPNGAPGNLGSPLLRSVERDHIAIVGELLRHGADPESCDKRGRTCLNMAAWKGHWNVLGLLIKNGANVNAKDNRDRNVLHNLAADKTMNWGDSVVELLLRERSLDSEAQDETKRTPLIWACAEGKRRFAEQLLTRPLGRANIDATEIRDKTSLHLAAIHNRDDIVELLLLYGADVHAQSDGGWTPFHNSCQNGCEKIVRQLVKAGSDINGKLLNGRSGLHLAAEGGHVEVVKYLLSFKHIKRTARDSFGSTPFLRAAQYKRNEIVDLLAPYNNLEFLSADAIGACKGFSATIVDFGNYSHGNKAEKQTVGNKTDKKTVFELLYARDTINPRKPAVTIRPKPGEFRWIHLPANNMAWVESLLTKLFIEEGGNDIDGFKALERSLTNQHRGHRSHSHFMRPLCQKTTRSAPKQPETENPKIILNGPEARPMDDPTPLSRQSTATSGDLINSLSDLADTKFFQKDRSKKGKGSKSPKPAPETPTPKELRKVKYLNKISPSPTSPGRKDFPQTSRGNLFLFLPYLHFESSERCGRMQEAIERAEKYPRSHPRSDPASSHDEMLIRAHLASSTASLHVRRTLDQSFYHNIDTQARDKDQVVYRYQKNRRENPRKDPNIVMVDQLWMWVLGKDLVITAFPQRWGQPKRDPLNVLDSIIEDLNDTTREPVQSVYDLAMVITGRCCGVFDRHRGGDEDYQFLDMFESSIGDATDCDSRLFDDFNRASRHASAWLQHHRRLNRPARLMPYVSSKKAFAETDAGGIDDLRTPEDFKRGPEFIDKLLDIGQETNLLAETKDIRDELNMIRKVLEDQQHVLPTIEAAICEIYADEQIAQRDVKKSFASQGKTVATHIKDIDRMDKQATKIYVSVTDMLDLKQKHANAFEARFARDQASATARQSQTVMVFTIVTIIFLPMSFLAAVFAINVKEFPNNEGGLPIGWVAKYMFGIGLSISFPMIFFAFYLDDIGAAARRLRGWRFKRQAEREECEVEVDKKSVLDLPGMDQVFSVARSARKSVENGGWVRERFSGSVRRPGTVGSLKAGFNGKGEGNTGFRIKNSVDIESG
ncbi:hypothetical protein HYFRA_00011095, partial [Hymenoscyphus fraxineus]